MSTVATPPTVTSLLQSRQEVADGTMAFRFDKPLGWSFVPLVGERRQTKDDQDHANRCDGVYLVPYSCKTTVSSEVLTLSPSL